MQNHRLRIILSIAAMLALLAGSMTSSFSSAKEGTQAGQPDCPPMNASMAQNPGFIKSLPAKCRVGLDKTASSIVTAFSQSLLLANGGPDDFGYTYDDTVPVNWLSPSAPGLTGDDGYIGTYSPGFNFPFYGNTYAGFYINFNGFLTFDQGVCCVYGGAAIPTLAQPNNLIAPFWDDLVMGAPYNSGGLYYESGGVAPDRYFVAEWRDVTTYAGSDPFSFEVILYENGDIIFQYQSLPASYYSTVGIENSSGDDGLGYQSGATGLSAPKAIKFFYPSGPIPRVSVSPLNTGKFASTTAATNFPVSIKNTGSAGLDTYDLSLASTWPASLYQDGCITPLTDTDADTVIDTGPMPEGSSTTICVSFLTPNGSGIGASNSGVLSVTSSIDAVRTKDALFSIVIPTSFVQVFEDYTNAAMAFQLNGPEGPSTHFITNDLYYANGPAVVRMDDGRYVYVWRKPDGNYPDSHSNIEFSLLNADGNFDVPVTQLTNNIGTGQTYDYSPSVAVTPNGNIGITWYRWIVDNNTGLYNYNIYFAVLSNTGTVLLGPSNLTNNDQYDSFDNLAVPHFFSPSIAGTDDNRFILSWQNYQTDGNSIFNNNIWYTTRDSNGAGIFAPTPLTNDDRSNTPILDTLSNGNAIVTWNSYVLSPAFKIYSSYAVISGSGSVTKAATPLETGGSGGPTTDSIHLPNGNTAIAIGQDNEVALMILDPDYNILAGPTFAATPNTFNIFISVTHDEAGNIVMTWLDGASDPSSNLYYALADSSGTFLTHPTLIRNSASGLISSENGQGNAPMLPAIQMMEVDIDVVPASPFNIIIPKAFLVPVAILSADGFNAVSDVDRSSLTFGKTGDESSLLFCLKKGFDVNRDGRRDLICSFRISKTELTTGDTQAILHGTTAGGTAFEGTDSVKVRKARK